ncbi:single-stranded-DNA-specific exonuclease RecJ [Candidatus Endolissoclinum faulkneri L5]|uniref:Single-stranded-DNA-specific exonuclease RecJ n=1 Tax=Candidatus Endolissoclinum faulkneri L5 TaxID=1401328 RepID=V9TUQ9_9PROT|nr:single-stranded-DNA-specific exonuclease RecJ [Candidatus Endolissoclinum faulkneri]AHC73887.1 single-stranded-DNA-specific exonuclease RecJ [Candidatus Endolissoclinum faulkneri L5]
MSQSNAFLGVEQSLTLRRWVLNTNGKIKNVDKLGLAIAHQFALPETVGQIMAQRGIELDAVECFLRPTLKVELPDPKRFIDMEFAVNRLVEAVLLGQIIGLFADYDVDGATSAASMTRYFRAVGASVLIYVPDRIDEGYGPSMPALQDLVIRGAKVVVCLDCGILAIETLAQAMKARIDVIVVDHHVAGSELPAAIAVVNPNRLDELAGFGYLAACGVTFLTLVAVNRALRDKGWFTRHAEPDLKFILDLTALGTVCDVVPLTGLNRAFVVQGLKVMARRSNIGLAALADVAGLGPTKPTAYHLGFVLGPRINAGGRMGKSDLGAKLLSTKNIVEARRIAKTLDYCNNKRKVIEAGLLRSAIAQAKSARDAPLLVVSGNGWHSGVIGIIASRLKDRFYLPACVISIDEKGIGRGSGRSVPGINLADAIIAAHRVGLLESGGGHAMAVGFTVAASRIDEFTAFLIEWFASLNICSPLMHSDLSVDALLAPSETTVELARSISLLAPFGVGNLEPRFIVSHAKVESSGIVNNKHVKCTLVGYHSVRIESIAFHAVGNTIGSSLLQVHKGPMHVAGYLRLNNSRGNYKVQLVIDDLAQAV